MTQAAGPGFTRNFPIPTDNATKRDEEDLPVGIFVARPHGRAPQVSEGGGGVTRQKRLHPALIRTKRDFFRMVDTLV